MDTRGYSASHRKLAKGLQGCHGLRGKAWQLHFWENCPISTVQALEAANKVGGMLRGEGSGPWDFLQDSVDRFRLEGAKCGFWVLWGDVEPANGLSEPRWGSGVASLSHLMTEFLGGSVVRLGWKPRMSVMWGSRAGIPCLPQHVGSAHGSFPVAKRGSQQTKHL